MRGDPDQECTADFAIQNAAHFIRFRIAIRLFTFLAPFFQGKALLLLHIASRDPIIGLSVTAVVYGNADLIAEPAFPYSVFRRLFRTQKRAAKFLYLAARSSKRISHLPREP